MKEILVGFFLLFGMIFIVVGDHNQQNIYVIVGIFLLGIYHSIMWKRGKR